jgi:salicylate hydroxylase
MAGRRPYVAVVGGGIGGLAAAIGLRQRGMEVVVHEQSTEVAHQGAGIAVGANGHRVFRELGVAESLKGSAVEPLRADFRQWNTGRCMVSHPLAGAYEERFEAPFWTVERAAVQQALLARLGMEHVRLGARCTEVETTDHGAVIRFADGTESEADAVMGADGIHSVVRHSVFGPEAAVFSGTSGYRALIPMERLRHVPQLAEPVLWLWLGPGRHFIAYPVAGGSALNFLACRSRTRLDGRVLVHGGRHGRAAGGLHGVASVRHRHSGGLRAARTLGPVRPRTAADVEFGAGDAAR